MLPVTTAKILIVDDDEGVTQTFARMLRLEGYHVRTAMTAEIGLMEADQGNPDAIILDLRMPLVDGLGIIVSTRGAQLWTTPGHPSAIAPRKRPFGSQTKSAPFVVVVTISFPFAENDAELTESTFASLRSSAVSLAASPMPRFS